MQLIVKQNFFKGQCIVSKWAKRLVPINKIMLEYFKSNKVYSNKPNQQIARICLLIPGVQLVVEKNSLKRYCTKMSKDIIFYQQNHIRLLQIKWSIFE